MGSVSKGTVLKALRELAFCGARLAARAMRITTGNNTGSRAATRYTCDAMARYQIPIAIR